MKKTILITIDGMRPDGFLACGNPFSGELMRRGSYTLHGTTVFPTKTLPCHRALFQSAPPSRLGELGDNDQPDFPGLIDLAHAAGRSTAMFYGWEPLRAIAKPKSLTVSEYLWAYATDPSDAYLTDRALECIRRFDPDFLFLYLVETDEKGGHDHGWMTGEYLARISAALNQVRRVLDEVGQTHSVLLTADHGGHDRTHGKDIPEDRTIPMFGIGEEFLPGREWQSASILDLAPTAASLLELTPPPEWEGKVLF